MAEANVIDQNALFARLLNPKADSGGGNADSGGSASGNTDSNNNANAIVEDKPANGAFSDNAASSDSTNAEAQEKNLSADELAAANKPDLQKPTEQELAQRRASELAAQLGLSNVETENLKLSALSGGSEQAMQQNLTKITGINPAILAMAMEAGEGARAAGMGNAREFALTTGRNFDEEKRIVGESQQREPASGINI